MNRFTLAMCCGLSLLVAHPVEERAPTHAAAPASQSVRTLSVGARYGDSLVAAHRGGTVVELSTRAMGTVHGDGWFRRIFRFIKCRIVTYMVPGGPYRRECQAPESTTQVVSTTYATERTDYYSEEGETTDTYEEDGSLVSSTYKTTGEVYEYTEESGT